MYLERLRIFFMAWSEQPVLQLSASFVSGDCSHSSGSIAWLSINLFFGVVASCVCERPSGEGTDRIKEHPLSEGTEHIEEHPSSEGSFLHLKLASSEAIASPALWQAWSTVMEPPLQQQRCRMLMLMPERARHPLLSQQNGLCRAASLLWQQEIESKLILTIS
jgi:hypothetical protein